MPSDQFKVKFNFIKYQKGAWQNNHHRQYILTSKIMTEKTERTLWEGSTVIISKNL